MSTEKTCPVCVEPFTSCVRCEIQCGGCEYTACKDCCKTYILGKSSDPHCMNCKQKWTRDFMFDNFGRGFVNTTYKTHKKDLLFEIEKSKIPATMPRVEVFKEVAIIEKEQKLLGEKVRELKLLIQETNRAKGQCYYKIQALKDKPFSKPKEFKHHCPVSECKGFLSKQWKCPVCTTWACSKCHQIIGYRKDDPHICKKEDIESVEAIKKTTKPCPTCVVPIQKSVGCNQMWCTQCQVAFDWKSGEIQNGVIHNPHFFEAKKTGMIRAPGDNVCGGLPSYWDWEKIMGIYLQGTNTFKTKCEPGSSISNKRRVFDDACAITYRTAGENVDTVNRLRRDVTWNNGPNMERLRIDFITGVIDEKKFKTLISTQENSREKKQANLDILEIYNTVTIENFQAIVAKFQELFRCGPQGLSRVRQLQWVGEDIQSRLMEILYEFNENIRRIKDYVNKRATKIGYYYNQSIYIVNDRGGMQTRRKVSKTELDERMAFYDSKTDESSGADYLYFSPGLAAAAQSGGGAAAAPKKKKIKINGGGSASE